MPYQNVHLNTIDADEFPESWLSEHIEKLSGGFLDYENSLTLARLILNTVEGDIDIDDNYRIRWVSVPHNGYRDIDLTWKYPVNPTMVN